ncbi:MAG: sulfatase [Muribaculaceae bacterium]|nr:sulfatase [Muribaculaceae bacterium]
MKPIYPMTAALLTLPVGMMLMESCSKTKDRLEKKPYNIVYIMTDDHTAQMMSCYDTRYASTPNLDRIAEDGVRFTRSYVANSISGPSRACILTGKHSHKNGYIDNTTCGEFDGSQPTFPKYLQQAGYETAIFGKWHLKSTPTGFDKWEVVPGQGDYYNPRFIVSEGDTIVEHGYITDLITDKSLAWLDKREDQNKPFCLLIHHKAQHRNWMPDTAHLSLYEDREFEFPDNFFDTYEGRPAAATAEMRITSEHDMDIQYDLKMYNPEEKTRLQRTYVRFVNRMDSAQRAAWDRFYDPIIKEYYEQRDTMSQEEMAKWRYTRYMRDYLKTLKSLDDNVGRVLDYLEEHNMLDNTLVIYTSDQGFYMGEHGWFDKRFMYEESLNTPLVMHLPKGLEARGDINEMVQNIDYAPTFLDIAGVEIPDDIQGESMLPLLRGEHPENWRDQIYYHFYEYPAEHAAKRHYGVRGDRYKLIHFYNDIDHWELYDLANDPTEMNNLYGKPGMEEVTENMMQRLKNAQLQYEDPIDR